MSMAVKRDGETSKLAAKNPMTLGRLKSDITDGKEKIYERSYY